jgi:hypothetical protein
VPPALGSVHANSLPAAGVGGSVINNTLIENLYNQLRLEEFVSSVDNYLSELSNISGGFINSVVLLSNQLGGDIKELAKKHTYVEVFGLLLQGISVPEHFKKNVIYMLSTQAHQSSALEDVSFNIEEIIPPDLIKNTNKWKRNEEGHLEIRSLDEIDSSTGKPKLYSLDEWFSMSSGEHAKALRKADYTNFNTACWMGGSNAFDNDECLKQIVDIDLWKYDDKAIDHMSPLVAYSILKSLQFKGIKDTERNYIKVQDADDWWSSLEDTHKALLNIPFRHANTTGPSFDSLKATANKTDKNVTLVKFLAKLVNFINSNPEILNVTPVSKSNNIDLNSGVYKVGPVIHNRKLINQPLFKVREHINFATK